MKMLFWKTFGQKSENGKEVTSKKIPRCYRIFTLAELVRRPVLFNSLVSVYQKIYGGSPWNEGGICDNCNRTIPLDEFRIKKENSQIRCECGGRFSDFYPQKKLEEQITHQLTLTDTEKPILILMRGEKGSSIGGFLIGTVGKGLSFIAKRTKMRIDIKNYYKEKEIELERDLEILGFKLKRKGILKAPFIYWEDWGILQEFREGPVPIAEFVKILFKQGKNYDCGSVLMWTSLDSKAFNLARKFGFNKVHETKKGHVYMILKEPRFSFILKTLQIFTPEQIKKIFFPIDLRKKKDKFS